MIPSFSLPRPLGPALTGGNPARRIAVGLVLAGLAVAAGVRLAAQVEGDRGIAPVAISTDIEVSGISVNTTGKTAEEARLAGWEDAEKQAWAKAGGAPMGTAEIASMVSAVVIGHEEIGPHRYIATLGVVFDRARAGQYLAGGNTARAHSAPLLTIPVLTSGGAAQVYEVKGAWQKAWAEFTAGLSPIDYVRPSGADGDSLLITAGQPGRRSRLWWHTVLAQFGAADVIVPEARLQREWPGGPVHGVFTARFGPDNRVLDSFEMTARSEDEVEAMLKSAVTRLDQIYAQALADGKLQPDPNLTPRLAIDPAIAALIAQGQAADAAARARAAAAAKAAAGASPTPGASEKPAAEAPLTSMTIQFASPDAAAVDSALAAVRSVPGVQSATTVSIAMGGTSVMRVTYRGELAELAAALKARGFAVAVGARH